MSNSLRMLQRRPKEHWRGEPIEVRQAFIETELVVLYPEIVRALNEIKRLMKRSLTSNKGRAIQVLWSSGGGKSHFIRLLKKLWPPEETDAATLVRIADFSVPGAPNQERLTKAMLIGIRDPGWNRKGDGTRRAFEIIADVGVWAIAIDNVQDIPEHRGKIGTRVSSNWIRDLIEYGQRLVILLGTPAAEEVVRSNPQLRRRNPGKLNIPYFKIDPEVNLKRFKRFLHEVDDQLPIAELSNLEQYAKRIYWATYGIADYIFKLLAEAVGIAVSAGREQLNEADLAGAFNLLFQDAGCRLNPFVVGGPSRELDRDGEPFDQWDANASVERTSDNVTARKAAKKGG